MRRGQSRRVGCDDRAGGGLTYHAGCPLSRYVHSQVALDILEHPVCAEADWTVRRGTPIKSPALFEKRIAGQTWTQNALSANWSPFHQLRVPVPRLKLFEPAWLCKGAITFP